MGCLVNTPQHKTMACILRAVFASLVMAGLAAEAPQGFVAQGVSTHNGAAPAFSGNGTHPAGARLRSSVKANSTSTNATLRATGEQCCKAGWGCGGCGSGRGWIGCTINPGCMFCECDCCARQHHR